MKNLYDGDGNTRYNHNQPDPTPPIYDGDGNNTELNEPTIKPIYDGDGNNQMK